MTEISTSEVVNSSLSSYEMTLLKKEIKKLDELLMKDEKVESIIKCRNAGKFGALVLTNLRLVFVHIGFLFGSKVESYPLKNITTVGGSTGVVRGSISVVASTQMQEYDQIELKHLSKFRQALQQKIV